MNSAGNKIKELRNEKNLTQKELAMILHIPIPTLSHWECGYTEPSHKDIIAICNFFNIPADYLLGRTDDFGTIISTATKQQSVATTTLSAAAKTQLGEISPIEEQLILDFRKLPAQTQDYVIGITRNLAAGN